MKAYQSRIDSSKNVEGRVKEGIHKIPLHQCKLITRRAAVGPAERALLVDRLLYCITLSLFTTYSEQ